MKQYLSPPEAARRADGLCTPVTIWRWCREFPGFALKVGTHNRIPVEHIDRLKSGETAAQIAANPSWRGTRAAA